MTEYEETSSRLIVLRGPSGSGKSTVAKRLFRKAEKRIALIEQDHYRFIFNPAGGGSKPNSDTIHKMITSNVILALKDGYDVILEGILNANSYKKVFDVLIEEHPNNNFIFYFDISFKETIKRHRTKSNQHEWKESDMREWYKPKDHLGYEFEDTISEDSSIDETVATIKEKARI